MTSRLLIETASPSLANPSQLSPVVAWFGDEGTAALRCLIAQGESRLPGEGKDLGYIHKGPLIEHFVYTIS